MSFTQLSKSITLGLSALAGVTTVAMTSGPSADDRLPRSVARHIATLEAALQRRFHDKKDVDFGFNRVSRPGQRRHVGPTTYIVPKNRDPRIASFNNPKHPGEFLARDGKWYPLRLNRPMMEAESSPERIAIDGLVQSQVNIAIYTVETLPTSDGAARVKGPAYITMTAPDAPKPTLLLKSFHEAWKTGKDHVVLTQADGTVLYCSRVKADDRSCVTCHAESLGIDKQLSQEPSKREQIISEWIGKPVGMFVIAVQRKPR